MVAPQVVVEGDQSAFLRLISKESIIISETDGREILVKADGLFTYIDPDFGNWNVNETAESTTKAIASVYEMARDATFSQMFKSLSADLGKLCLTQSQIKAFVRNNRSWFRSDGSATFFLLKSRDHFFVAYVRVHSDDKLYVYVDRFRSPNVWNAVQRPRVVVPQLA